MSMSATYSPEDNKLRLYSVARLGKETYARVKAAGFKWTPKQELFVAPAWTPGREDLLIELCGEIGDEDTSLVERQEQRAERFEDYSEKRESEADRAKAASDALADSIPFGQPILVGHHSERRARRDAERIRSTMTKAVRLWETAKYWEDRAAGAIRHAKYKELPAVRARRIKGLEADLRKYVKDKDTSVAFGQAWKKENLDRAKAMAIANYDRACSGKCFPLAQFPRELPASQYEGAMGLWSALDNNIITAEQARTFALESHEYNIAWCQRWINHLENRLAYERAMLKESGGFGG